MAHCEKYTLAQARAMFAHYERVPELERGYERENINQALTSHNYNLHETLPAEEMRRAMETHKAVTGRGLRRDANVMFDWVVTKPEDCPECETRLFFEAVVKAIGDRYGDENVLGAYVHLDETTPHVHVPVLPRLDDGRLSAWKVVTKHELQVFHPWLNEQVDKALGHHVSLTLDDSQQAQKELSRLDQGAYKQARREIAETETRLAEVHEQIRCETQRLESLRQAREATAERVAILEPIAQAVREFDDCPRRERRAALDKVVAAVDNGIERATDAFKRVERALRALLSRPQRQSQAFSGKAPSQALRRATTPSQDRRRSQTLTRGRTRGIEHGHGLEL